LEPGADEALKIAASGHDIERAIEERKVIRKDYISYDEPYYSVRNDAEETKGRCLWGYKKLPDNLKRIVANFRYEDKEVEFLLREVIAFSGT